MVKTVPFIFIYFFSKLLQELNYRFNWKISIFLKFFLARFEETIFSQDTFKKKDK